MLFLKKCSQFVPSIFQAGTLKVTTKSIKEFLGGRVHCNIMDLINLIIHGRPFWAFSVVWRIHVAIGKAGMAAMGYFFYGVIFTSWHYHHHLLNFQFISQSVNEYTVPYNQKIEQHEIIYLLQKSCFLCL